MIKLNCGVSRKIGEPNFGSRGASVNVEMELESAAAGDSQLLHDRMRKLFALAKTAVDEELGLVGRQEVAPVSTPVPAAALTTNGAGGNHARPATEAQIRAIRAICERQKIDPDQAVRKKFNCSMAELTLPDASSMIDHLKALPAGGK